MPTNRVPVRHSRKIVVTDEMAELFQTGLEILRDWRRRAVRGRHAARPPPRVCRSLQAIELDLVAAWYARG